MWKEDLKNIRNQLFETKNSSLKTNDLPIDTTHNHDSKKVKYKGSVASQEQVSNGRLKESQNVRTNKAQEVKQKRNKKKRQRKSNNKYRTQVSEPLCLIGNSRHSTSPRIEEKKENETEKYELNIADLMDKAKKNRPFQFAQDDANFTIDWCEPKVFDSAESIEIFVGLDFGTAFTKVVLGVEPYHYLIEFGDKGALQPSELWIDKEGRVSLEEISDSQKASDLKLPVLQRSATKEDTILIVAFLALVLKKCRTWFESSAYQDSKPIWFLNAGLPTESYHDKYLKAEYSEIVEKAWNLSFARCVSLKNAKRLIGMNRAKNIIPTDAKISNEQINLFPEFIAQITGYVRSPKRRNYSHLLIDIGAGTVDIALFNVKNDNGDWYFRVGAKRIEMLGVDILNKHRCNCLSINFDCAPILSSLDFEHEFTADVLNVSVAELDQIDLQLSKKVNNAINETLNLLGTRSKIKENIITFLCGGGRHITAYNRALIPIIRDFPIEKIEIPEPEDLIHNNESEEDYHRFSVAYGLSNDPYNIGQAIQIQLDDVESLSIRSGRVEDEIRYNQDNLYKN